MIHVGANEHARTFKDNCLITSYFPRRKCPERESYAKVVCMRSEFALIVLLRVVHCASHSLCGMYQKYQKWPPRINLFSLNSEPHQYPLQRVVVFTNRFERRSSLLHIPLLSAQHLSSRISERKNNPSSHYALPPSQRHVVLCLLRAPKG